VRHAWLFAWAVGALVGCAESDDHGGLSCPEYANDPNFQRARILSGACSREQQTCTYQGPGAPCPNGDLPPDLSWSCSCSQGS
jgi:hypothetical protein